MMKQFLLMLLLLCSLLVSCDRGDNKSKSTTARVRSVAQEGLWSITYFIDSDSDESDHFIGYSFDFGSDNTLTAVNDVDSYPGTWSVTKDDSDDDDDLDDLNFNVYFNAPSDFQELSEDWEIISLSNLKIELRHVSGGNGGTDLLTFEKIQ
jgi:hypothetical protein